MLLTPGGCSTKEFSSSLECVYDSPLFQFHRGHGLASFRLMRTSKGTTIPDVGCDIC